MQRIIIVVDDSPVEREGIVTALTQAGKVVLQAGCGTEALNLLKHQHPGTVGLIITDIFLPDMDGFEFIKAVKKTKFNAVPVLVLTKDNQEAQKKEGQVAGASGWMVKPFEAATLTDVVAKFLD